MQDKNSSRCGYTHQIVGQKWVPGGALLSRGRVWPVDVPETSCKSMPTLLNGSWECYHLVRIGLGAIWGDHGRRRSLHFTTPHFVLKSSGYTHFCPFPKFKLPKAGNGNVLRNIFFYTWVHPDTNVCGGFAVVRPLSVDEHKHSPAKIR